MKIRETNGHTEVFDPLRKKYVALTPEEKVRQELILFLNNEKKVPLHMMAAERGLNVNMMPKRFDLLVFGTGGKPVMIAECKAPGIPMNEEVFYQAARYNLALQVNYLLITNGTQMHCLFVDYESGNSRFLQDIPEYNIIKL